MPNACTFRRSLIRGYLSNPTAGSTFPLDAETTSLVATLGIRRQLLRFSSGSLGYLLSFTSTSSSFSSPSLSFSLSLALSHTLYPVVSRTPSRITKTNSSLVVSCNLRKTRATISELGPTPLQFLTDTRIHTHTDTHRNPNI